MEGLRDSEAAMADLDLEERAMQRSERGRAKGGRGGGRAGRGGGGGGGGGGGAGGKGRETQVSRALSRLLRHQAQKAGIELDKEGYAPLDKVMAWQPLRSLKVTFSDIQTAVSDNDKQRFSMLPATSSSASASASTSTSTDPKAWKIRANQGHSIKLDSEALLRPVTLEAGNVPEVVVHGTFFRFWGEIVRSGGLRRMGRNHVHCATGVPEGRGGGDKDGGGGGGGVISGMRGDAELLVFIDVRRTLEDGAMKWWVSENGVVLTEGDDEGVVATRYFKEVRGRKGGVGVLWRDGEKVADLEVEGRMPVGKEKAMQRGERQLM